MCSQFTSIGMTRTELIFWETIFLRRKYTQRNIFEVLLNQPEIRLYLPFSDWFGSKRTSVWIKIYRIMVNTIWNQVDILRFRKNFSVCNHDTWRNLQRLDFAVSGLDYRLGIHPNCTVPGYPSNRSRVTPTELLVWDGT